jgi:hypothetical protein
VPVKVTADTASFDAELRKDRTVTVRVAARAGAMVAI